tara:strand:- start:131 stop:352 length:222 start_codon:yes stop_codon:yes gene_type:complete
MSNDHAQDRYDPPKVGTEFEEDQFSEINIGVVFRLYPNDDTKQYRKSNDSFALDLKEQIEVQLKADDRVYVKS